MRRCTLGFQLKAENASDQHNFITVIRCFLILGDSIADVKFNPEDLFLGKEDQDLEFEVSR